MRDLRHLMLHVKTYGRKHQALYLLSLMILFWAVFDGMTTYLTPLVLTESGMSKTAMGLIIGCSSVFGAGFDFLMCRLFKNSYWRRVFLLMFSLSWVYLLILAAAKTIGMFMLAMALWGIYYDLKNFGSFDFVARFTKGSEHGSSFGVLSVFQSGGYLIAPLIAGLLIGSAVGRIPFAAAGIFLSLAMVFFLNLTVRESRFPRQKLETQYRYGGLIRELNLWRRLDKVLIPVLLTVGILSLIDAFFWTIGPLMAESFIAYHRFAGLFMVAYELPILLTGWWVGRVNRVLGKKRTAFLGLLAGSLLLTGVGFISRPEALVALVFAAAACLSLAWPSLRAAFADYIREAGRFEQEIEGLEDLYTNTGYIIGPAAAGFLADRLGNGQAFSLVGAAGVLTAVYLLKTSPKHINVRLWTRGDLNS